MTPVIHLLIFSGLKKSHPVTLNNIYCYIFFKVYFTDYVITAVPIFSLFAFPHLVPPFPPAISPLSSCPWVMHVSSLASPFPILFFLLFLKRFYLFIFRERERKKERERNINVCLPLVHPWLGTGLQPRHVPWLGIEPTTLWFTGWHSIHWATPARDISYAILNFSLSILFLPIILLNLCTIFPLSPFPLQMISISMILFLF